LIEFAFCAPACTQRCAGNDRGLVFGEAHLLDAPVEPFARLLNPLQWILGLLPSLGKG
jgi:hypothetical protein